MSYPGSVDSKIHLFLDFEISIKNYEHFYRLKKQSMKLIFTSNICSGFYCFGEFSIEKIDPFECILPEGWVFRLANLRSRSKFMSVTFTCSQIYLHTVQAKLPIHYS